MMRALIKSIAVSAWLLLDPRARSAAQTAVTGATLFQNVRIFDGKGKTLVGAVERAGARQQDRAHLRARRSPTDAGAPTPSSSTAAGAR